eukprot:m.58107 g.58107  ORF g.58107 m.58107 type:complete len:382 (+) comp17189_c0_seq1:21-1166(+)
MAVPAYLQGKVAELQESSPDVAAIWNTLESQYSRRLWHQLTLTLLDFVYNDCFTSGGLTELYEQVIRDVEDRINPLSLIKMVNVVIGQIEDPAAALLFIEPLGNKIKTDNAASISLKTMTASLNTRLGNYAEATKVLEECESQLDELQGVTPVHANYYKVSAELYKIEARFAKFYAAALRYLGCVELKELQESDAVELANDLCLAALLGDGIYNMGELLSHGILDFLRDTQQQWLVDLVGAFNAGDVAGFVAMKEVWSTKSGDLVSAEEELFEKIRLLSIMEHVFRRQSKDRKIAFSEIAASAQIDESSVEMLVMKALCIGLVRGSIDQIDQAATFTWVQPRVLDLAQLADIHSRLGTWLERVDATSTSLVSSAPELFASA